MTSPIPSHRPMRILLLGALLTAVAGAVWAQAPAPGGTPSPPPAAAPAPAPTPPPATAGARATLADKPGDPSDADEVMIPARPVAILSGSSTWDQGFDTLKKTYDRLGQELAKAGLAPAGRPVTLYTKTGDDGFSFDAMIPIERQPEPRPSVSPDVRFGTTPSGRALRFVHKGAYEDIESTYETITAYIDAKDFVVQDVFLEEYVTDLTKAADEDLEVNVYALFK